MSALLTALLTVREVRYPLDGGLNRSLLSLAETSPSYVDVVHGVSLNIQRGETARRWSAKAAPARPPWPWPCAVWRRCSGGEVRFLMVQPLQLGQE